MKTENRPKIKVTIREIKNLLVQLKGDICDDYRVSDDAEDDKPGINVTIGADEKGWSYQTGDNSFTGGAYGFKHWANISLYRNSNCLELARNAVDELWDLAFN